MKAPIFRATLGVFAALVGLVLLASPPSLAARRVVTDSAGRRVEIPERVERVYAAGVPASIVVYALAGQAPGMEP